MNAESRVRIVLATGHADKLEPPPAISSRREVDTTPHVEHSPTSKAKSTPIAKHGTQQRFQVVVPQALATSPPRSMFANAQLSLSTKP